MKTKNTIASNKQDKKDVPVFNIEDMQQEPSGHFQPSPDPISFFDIKELYDRAYTAKNQGHNDSETKKLMSEAIKMDMAYRCQLARHSKYTQHSQINDFKIISDSL